MADKSVMKKMAISACVVCCAVNLAIILSAAGLFSSFAFLGTSPISMIVLGFALIGAASFLIWKRNRKAACCEVANT